MTNDTSDTKTADETLTQQQDEFESQTFDIAFHYESKDYQGWVTPSDKLMEDGSPKSFHVVLNEVFFGNLSYHNEQWEADTQRENGLIQATGIQIEKHY